MKSMAGFSVVSLAISVGPFLIAQPTVTPVSAEQIQGQQSVRIGYGLRHSGGLDCTATVSASEDGGNPFLEVSSLTGDRSAEFPDIGLDLRNGETVWQESSWYGWFYDMESPWIWHVEHGCQYCMGDTAGDTDSIFFYDIGLNSWIWTCTSLYPYIYKFGENDGWYWYFTGGTPGSRWFARMADFVYAQEGEINEPIHYPTPASFSLVPEGEFEMGDVFGDGYANELPVRTVYLSGYYIQQTEVTNAQVVEVMNWAIAQGLASANSETMQNLEGVPQALLDLDSKHGQLEWDGSNLVLAVSGQENFPCLEITWYGAMAYCHYLVHKEGNLTQAVDMDDWSMDISADGYRLPTEAEWEKAARGGLIGKRYPWGDSIDSSLANYNAFVGITTEVGSYPESGYKLYDIIGNLWEWCADWYGAYSSGAVNNPLGPASGSDRVIRGGSWGYEGHACRVSNRYKVHPDYSDISIGFRPVRSAGH